MSGQICKGLVFNMGAFTTDSTDPKGLQIDADGTGVAAFEEFLKTVEKGDGTADWDGVLASCRGWYDKAEYGKPFCCQGLEVESLGINIGQTQVEVYNSEATESADPIEIDLLGMKTKYTPWAEVLGSARLGGAAILSALVFLN